MGDGDQLGVIVLLGAAVAVGLVLFGLVVMMGRLVWAWIRGEASPPGARPRKDRKADAAQPGIASVVTASDLFTVRSNLNAVARQIEDLERRLRLDAIERGKVVEPARK